MSVVCAYHSLQQWNCARRVSVLVCGHDNSVYASKMRGMRPYQEDTFCLRPKALGECGIVGVYDGHGGDKTSRYVYVVVICLCLRFTQF